MKKFFLIIALFFSLGARGKLSTLPNPKEFLKLQEFFLRDINGIFVTLNLGENLRNVFETDNRSPFERYNILQCTIFSELCEIVDSECLIKGDVLKENFEWYLDKQFKLCDYLSISTTSTEKQPLFVLGHKNIFFTVLSRLRAIKISDLLKEKYPKLPILLDLLTADVIVPDLQDSILDPEKSLDLSSSIPFSLRGFVISKGLNPENVNFEQLLGMLKREPKVYSEQYDLYKIHLMPKDGDLVAAASVLIDALNRGEFSGYVFSFKIKALLEGICENLDCPKIVIYLTGYECFQTVLAKIYELFKGWEGIGRVPAFNAEIGGNKFIYFAQGNRDDKKLWPEFYKGRDLVYFDDAIKEDLVSGGGSKVDQNDQAAPSSAIGPVSARELRRRYRQQQSKSGKAKSGKGVAKKSTRAKKRRSRK